MVGEVFLRIITIVLFLIRMSYWIIAAKNAEEKKPQRKISIMAHVRGGVLAYGVDGCILLQLFGVSFFPIKNSTIVLPIFGCLIVFLGGSIAFLGRQTLGENWMYGSQYQIKNRQQLITKGIYHVLRHPIYFGVTLSYIGAEMVCNSYLSLSFLAFFFVYYVQSKREETILLAHFGQQYQNYMKRTKMFIPFIF